MPDLIRNEMNQPLQGPETTVPQKQDEDVVKMALEMFEQAKTARAQYDSDWDKRLKYYRGEQWDKGRPAYKSKPVFNIIRSTIQSQLPLLTDNRPGFNVTPSEPTDYQFASTISSLVESWWDDCGMDHTLIEVLFDEMIYDAGVLKITWDQTAKNGQGDIKATVCDPRDIFVPFGARDFDKDCPYVIHRCVKTIGDLKKQFPDKASEIKPDGQVVESKTAINTDVILVSPQDKKGNNPQSPGTQPDSRKTVTVMELWITDDTVEEYALEQPDQNGNTTGLKKKYPLGRLITLLPNSRLLLQDVPAPYMHGKFPFVRFVDAILPRSFWGEGEVQALMEHQKIINKILANVIDYQTLMANPVWVTEVANGVDPERLTNAIGAVIQTSVGKAASVRREIPPGMQSGMIDSLQMFIRQEESISGITDVSQGRQAQGVTAAAAIQSLQEAAHTRIRLKERNLSVSLSQLGHQVVALMMQYYTTTRVVKLTGKDQASWPQKDFMEFFIERLPDDKVRYIKRIYQYNPDVQAYVPGQYEQSQPTAGTFDVKVLAGTSLPYAKTQRANVAFRLFDSQAIDTEELLDALEWPNKDKVLERMQAMQAQAQPQGPMQTGPSGPVGPLPPAGAGVTQS